MLKIASPDISDQGPNDRRKRASAMGPMGFSLVYNCLCRIEPAIIKFLCKNVESKHHRSLIHNSPGHEACASAGTFTTTAEAICCPEPAGA